MYSPHSECKKVKETVGKPKAAGLPGAAGRNTELPAEDPRDRNRRRSKRHRGKLKNSPKEEWLSIAQSIHIKAIQTVDGNFHFTVFIGKSHRLVIIGL